MGSCNDSFTVNMYGDMAMHWSHGVLLINCYINIPNIYISISKSVFAKNHHERFFVG